MRLSLSNRTISVLTDIEHGHEFRNVLRESEQRPVLLYKHSAVCGLSTMAEREILRLSERSDVGLYRVVVQKARWLSRVVERFFRVRHESPQAILIYERRAIFNASHRGIRWENVEEVLSGLGGTP